MHRQNSERARRSGNDISPDFFSAHAKKTVLNAPCPKNGICYIKKTAPQKELFLIAFWCNAMNGKHPAFKISAKISAGAGRR